ncbi:origin recognition complex subunit 2 isoform X1 [Zerene cesonia]|uniref:origin recognition complex subunit 2 isoform X1 n=1 Tax=Zerene cesonia TaxID=33412 RepID=UPI0018E54415|nr:origin recognition complex subunit 2 isoform X1 [Zerene cesonia]
MSKHLKLNFGFAKDDDAENKEENVLSTPRRATRHRNTPKRYSEFFAKSPVKRQTVNDISSDEEFLVEAPVQKSKALFGNDDVEGQDMYKFQSRYSRLGLQNKVKSAIGNSPSISSPLKTPRKSINLNKVEATPKQVVSLFKKRIIQEVDSESGESDFSGSSSDFVPDKSDEESEASSNSESEVEEQPQQISKPVRNRGNRMKQKDSEYIVTPDNYFMMHSSKKITTSDHTLSRLKNMNLNDNIKDIDVHISDEHQTRIKDLMKSYDYLYDRWLYVLSENFNIILYGIGSKRSILHKFQQEKLHNTPCIVINGFFPSLTIKNVLEAIVVDLLGNTHVPSNISDVIQIIDSQLHENETDLFLIIHNIDGTMLRNSKAQSVLAGISQLKNVHTIATIDHINAPLLWDHSKLSKFNFTWWDVTTFLPYTEETSFENSLMTQRSGALQLSSLKSVYQSLTTNARGIFNIIIEYQLENQKQTHYQGLAFKDLYSKSREQFLVSSELALRAQLTEFLDHKLVKIKRTLDGSENLVIPIESTLLQQFLEQNQ